MGVSMDQIRALMREAVAKAVDEVIDQLSSGEGGENTVSVLAQGEPLSSWSYRWMGGNREQYDHAQWFGVSGPSGDARVILGRCVRTVRSKPMKRYVVFAQVGGEDSETFYPWTEFVETDAGSYAAIIPNPARPRSALKDGEQLPARFASANVQRTDELYDAVSNGPSLRFVVPVPEEATGAMIRHGYWVAETRRRLRG